MITAVPDNTLPQKVFPVDWNLSFMYVHQLFPLFPPRPAREIVLLNKWKTARTFSKGKGVSNFAEMENYITLKQSGQWLNEIAETLSDYAKFLRLLRFFHCMKTWAMSKFCNGISQWNKRLSGMSRGKVLLWNETIFTKSEYYVNVNFFKL